MRGWNAFMSYEWWGIRVSGGFFIFSSFSFVWFPHFLIIVFFFFFFFVFRKKAIKNYIFVVGKEIHCVPWKYGRYFFFGFILFRGWRPTATKCGCSSIVPFKWTSEFITSPLGSIQWDWWIHSKFSEIKWHRWIHFLVMKQ